MCNRATSGVIASVARRLIILYSPTSLLDPIRSTYIEYGASIVRDRCVPVLNSANLHNYNVSSLPTYCASCVKRLNYIDKYEATRSSNTATPMNINKGFVLNRCLMVKCYERMHKCLTKTITRLWNEITVVTIYWKNVDIKKVFIKTKKRWKLTKSINIAGIGAIRSGCNKVGRWQNKFT